MALLHSDQPASSPALQKPLVLQLQAYTLLRAMGACWRGLSGASDLCQMPSDVGTLLGALDLGSMPPTPAWEHHVIGWRGGGAATAGEFPKLPQSVSLSLFFSLFDFEKFLLLSPAPPCKEGPVF